MYSSLNITNMTQANILKRYGLLFGVKYSNVRERVGGGRPQTLCQLLRASERGRRRQDDRPLIPLSGIGSQEDRRTSGVDLKYHRCPENRLKPEVETKHAKPLACKCKSH